MALLWTQRGQLCTLVHIRAAVDFEWDERKARANPEQLNASLQQ
jgi:hypothetical protein